jgi:MerR family transcriptional regulator, light-induced transcriptional regulator
MSRLEKLLAAAKSLRHTVNVEPLRLALERHVVPQLLEVHRAETPRALRPPAPVLEVLVNCVSRGDLDATRACAASWTQQGGTLEALVVEGARQLGDDWDADRRTFAEVTTGLGVLSALVSLDGDGVVANRGEVLLTTAPGEQHTLGLALVARSLRQAGWSVHLEPGLGPAALTSRLQGQSLAAVGFTVTREQPRLFVGGPITLDAFATAHGVTHLSTPVDAAAWLRSTGRAARGR